MNVTGLVTGSRITAAIPADIKAWREVPSNNYWQRSRSVEFVTGDYAQRRIGSLVERGSPPRSTSPDGRGW